MPPSKLPTVLSVQLLFLIRLSIFLQYFPVGRIIQTVPVHRITLNTTARIVLI